MRCSMQLIVSVAMQAIVLVTMRAVAVSGFRINGRKSRGVQRCSSDTSCECFAAYACSSCTFAKCPVLGNTTVQKSKKTANGLAGDTFKLTLSDGRGMIVKFGSHATWRGPVAAAQMAHRMEVPTPPALVVTEADCPQLFDVAHAETLDPLFWETVTKASRLGRTALLQEFVAPNTDVLPFCSANPLSGKYRSRPWVQVGLIAMFDWIIGKTDLFMDWQDSYMEDNPQNAHNILAGEELGKAVDIDLAIGGSAHLYLRDLNRVLTALINGDNAPWVDKNVLDVMRGFSFSEGPRNVQVRLGMTYFLHDVREHGEDISAMLSRYGADLTMLNLMREPSTSDPADLQTIITQLEGELSIALTPKTEAAIRGNVRCCVAQCAYSGKIAYIFATQKACKGGPSADGTYLASRPSSGCDHYVKNIPPTAVASRCRDVCKSGVPLGLSGAKEVTMPHGSC